MLSVNCIRFACITLVLILNLSCVHYNYVPQNENSDSSDRLTIYRDEKLSIDIAFLSDSLEWFPSYYSGLYFTQINSDINLNIDKIVIEAYYKDKLVVPQYISELIQTTDYYNKTVFSIYQDYSKAIKWYMNKVRQYIYIEYTIDGVQYTLKKEFNLKKVKSHTTWELLGSV